MDNYIVSFRGKMKAGKTTAAELLQSIEPSFQKVSFASAMKMEAVELVIYSTSCLEKEQPYRLPWVLFEKNHKNEALSILQDIPGPLTSSNSLDWANKNKAILRPWFQWYGEYKRKANSFYWIKQAYTQMVYHIVNGHSMVVDDCRYENEREFLEHLAPSLGYKYIDVYISNPELKAPEGIKNHKSEEMNSSVWFTGKEYFSKHLTNIPSHGIEEYRGKIEDLWKNIQSRS